ncbi:enoyl-CoA hydratase/isomerase family protein [Erythrobacteraceae bacterium E2-1 Yellow Sea]|nr:enoyl-CoA hydratase/isomerase family protein [Erythrobacteraceae bacterium E2-1 Yellow Sea]
MADYKYISVDCTGPVTQITLDRPDQLNALSPAMALEIRDALALTPGTRCFLITGAGRAFCSGADLSGGDGDGGLSSGRAASDTLSLAYNPLIQEMAHCPVPIVTAVNGATAGIGVSLALASDFVVAGESAYFLQAFVNIGLVPDGGTSWVLPRLVGKARATEMMLLGERLPAAKAADWGMIYKCVADDALLAEAGALASRLANGPTMALGMMRENLLFALQADLSSALHKEAMNQWRAGDTADAREGITAFLQKRKAEFKGE